MSNIIIRELQPDDKEAFISAMQHRQELHHHMMII